MTALPDYPQPPLTVAEYTALPEDESYRWELQEGALVMSPRPTPTHMRAMFELGHQLRAQLPPGWQIVPDVDVDLSLVADDQPGYVRSPDLVVVPAGTTRRTRAERRLIRAAEVTLIVEIVSPGSKRMDHTIKRTEYADAGIGHYWIVDLTEPVSLLACHHTGHPDFGYADSGEVTGTFHADAPWPLAVDLTTLIEQD